jgi:U3 small nucleolar RNA-associated protein 15
MFKPVYKTSLPIAVENEALDESKAWRAAVKPCKTIKETSAVTGLDLHPVSGNILITSSRITMYDEYLDHKKNYYSNSPFAKYGGVFRPSDGRLLVVGSATGKMFIYDTQSTKPLREVGDDDKTRHTLAVRRPIFSGQHNIISCSDDKTIKLWDVGDGSLVSTFGKKEHDNQVHENVIRASCLMTGFRDELFVSGSYDNIVKVWDSKNPEKEVTSFKTTGAVESLVSKNNLIIASSSGSIIVYDMLSNRILTTLNNIHSKTITCLGVIRNNFFSCGLDGFLKIFSTSTLKEVMQYKHMGSELTRLAVSKEKLVVGSLEAEVSIRGIRSDIIDAFERGGSSFQSTTSTRESRDQNQEKVDVTVSKESFKQQVKRMKREKSAPRLKRHDMELKDFNHSKALECALNAHNGVGGKPVSSTEVVAVMHELIRRGVLEVAVSGKKGDDLDVLFDFVNNNLTYVSHHRVLLDVSSVLIDVYADQIDSSEQVRKHLTKMNKILNREAKLMTQMKQLSGQLEMIQHCFSI